MNCEICGKKIGPRSTYVWPRSVRYFKALCFKCEYHLEMVRLDCESGDYHEAAIYMSKIIKSAKESK